MNFDSLASEFNQWPPTGYRTTAINHFVDFSSNALLDNPGTAGRFTVAGWFKENGNPNGTIPLFSKCDAAVTLGWAIRLFGLPAGGKINVVQFTNSTARTYNTAEDIGSLLVGGQWVFVAIVFDATLGTGLKFVVYYATENDPTLKTASFSTVNEGAGTDDTDAAESLKLGTRNGSNESGYLTFGPIAFWNNKLVSKAYLQEWLNNPATPVQSPTLLAFPNSSAGIYQDIGPYGLHGKIVGGGVFMSGNDYAEKNRKKRYWEAVVVANALTGPRSFGFNQTHLLSFS